jgi:hypothetical protein
MRLYGFPPMYYPNTTDFSAASEIKVKAGETAQINLRVEKREYFPVHMPLRNMPAGSFAEVKVTPVGSHSPGWSLGYMQGEEAVGGMMPDGNYAVTVQVRGESAMSGTAILSVKGRPAEGPAVVLAPNATVTVNIHEEFTADNTQNPGEGQVTLKTDNGEKFRIRLNAHVALAPVDELNSFGEIQPQTAGPPTGTQVIEGVPPGSYYVRIYADRSYAAAVQSGGTDLLRQPLVVGTGGSVAPIEVTLRNDGGEVSGTVVDDSGGAAKGKGPMLNQLVFLVPEEGDLSNIRMGVSQEDGTFKIAQVPPGNYVLVTQAEQGEPIALGLAGDMQELESMGQKVHVEAGGKVNVKVVAASQ